MNITEAILGLYPNLIPNVGFVVGAGVDGVQVIEAWNNPNPRPTQADLDKGWLLYSRRSKKTEFARRMHQENRALYGEVSDVEGAWVAEAMIDLVTEPRGARVASIKANKDKRARGYAAVDAAPSAEAVRALLWEVV